MHAIVGSHDVVLVTLDTLRLDVAQTAWAQGRLPVLSRWLPSEGFEARHSPASFTYAAHQAFLTGFLPTPILALPPGKSHPRLFALAFPGSESTTPQTYVFARGASLPEGFADLGYRTICVGGVGFFNKQNALGSVLPGLFQEAHWQPEFSVTRPDSTETQVALARQRLDTEPRRVFMLLNVSAIHQPNHHYLPAEGPARPWHQKPVQDSIASHSAALSYVDRALAPLWEALARRGPAFVVLCSDHGTAYGEDGYFGHRHAHPVVMHVPYAHFLVARA
jgi:hypothetical protein